jgi:hypothetical protein
MTIKYNTEFITTIDAIYIKNFCRFPFKKHFPTTFPVTNSAVINIRTNFITIQTAIFEKTTHFLLVLKVLIWKVTAVLCILDKVFGINLSSAKGK